MDVQGNRNRHVKNNCSRCCQSQKKTVKRKMLITADNSNRKFSCKMHSQRNAGNSGGG